MDSTTIVAAASILASGFAIAVGCLGPAFGMGFAISSTLKALAQQPDAAGTISRTLFIGLAMVESLAIYCFVISMILIFANPFWTHVVGQAAGN